MPIPEETLQQIKDYPLVEFVVTFVQLKRKGSSHIGNCPFHDEKSDSFDISPAKGMYKCFGCNKTGHNPIDFMIHLENLSFVDAVKRCMAILKISNESDNMKISFTPIPKRIKAALPIDYIPWETIRRNIDAYNRNNLYLFVLNKYGRNYADYIFRLYNVGSCTRHGVGTTLFVQNDINGNFRQAKAMLYDSSIGRRNKEFAPTYIGKNILAALGRPYDKINLAQCFFGEFLLKGNNEPAAIVESEKSSLVCSLFYDSYVWLATGGKNGCRWYSKEVSKVLAGRDIFLFPDVDALGDWTTKADELRANTGCKVTVVDIMNGAPPPPLYEKYDIADLLIDLNEPPPPLIMSVDQHEIESFPIETIYPDYKVQTIRTISGKWFDILQGQPKDADILNGFSAGTFCEKPFLIKELQPQSINF